MTTSKTNTFDPEYQAILRSLRTVGQNHQRPREAYNHFFGDGDSNHSPLFDAPARPKASAVRTSRFFE